MKLGKIFPGFFLLIIVHTSFAQVRLPQLIRDSMILQRDAKINVWGWAATGEKVHINFNKKNYHTAAGADGKWRLQLAPTKAGGPYTMHIDGSNHLVLHDILVGDVWLCSGQSNMVHQMALHSTRYATEIAQANYPMIRQFWIPTVTDLQQPRDNLPTGYWKCANPQDVLQFSAVAYFFGKALYKKYGVPIGLINSSVGGTPIEAWTSEEGLKEFPAITNTIEKNKDTAYINSTARKAAAYTASLPRPQDKGLTGAIAWYDTNYAAKNWHNITIPGYWEDQGIKDLDGIVWYRKEIDIPTAMTGVPATIFLGRIVDADVLYVNGKQVGTTTYQYPQRIYKLPAGVLIAGRNLIVVRVINYSGKGGFVPDKPYFISANGQTVTLKGDWQYKVGAAFLPQKNPVTPISLQNQPTALYNAMIAPVTNYSIKGILWYQGETNSSNASEYTRLLPALIKDWRSKWNEGAVPFIYAQLPGFGDVTYLPAESDWAVLRQAQLKTLSVPNTGMAVTIDLGEWNDVHPDDKKDVGDRLALAAEHTAYGEKNGVYSGPIYQSSVIKGNKMVLTFSNTGSGLTTNDGEALNRFAIAGADKKYVWANAKIEGNTVVVWSDDIADPKYVRYAWADSPDGANLYNKEGLPASPFETNNE